MAIGLLIMAAGTSQRFKQASNGMHKLLYPYDQFDIPMLSMTYQTALQAFNPEEICIVVNEIEPTIIQLAKTFQSPVLTIQSNGLGESIAQGVTHQQSYDGLLILHGDLPFIQADTICQVRDELHNASIVRPEYLHQLGHPVGFQKIMFPLLMNLKGDTGASSILKNHSTTVITTHDRGSIQDIDTPKDLERYLSA